MATTATRKKKTLTKAARPASQKGKPAVSQVTRVTVPSYDRHIEVTPGIRGGKPRIAGRRIAVEDIVSMHLKHDQSIEHIIDSYRLAPAQVYAALTYYYDHRVEIDRSLAEGVARYEAEKAARPSLVERKLAATSTPSDG